jgi:hypothetical protein
MTSPHSADFYDTGDDNLSASVIYNYELSCKIFDEIIKNSDQDNFELIGDLRESKNLLDKFEKNFRYIVAKYAKTGNEKAGLTAELSFSGDRAESKIKQFCTKEDRDRMANLRKKESEFLELHKPYLADEFLISAKDLSEKYSMPGGDTTRQISEVQMQISELMSEYINNFKLLTDLYKETGLGTKTGLDGKIQKIFEESEMNNNVISKILYDNIRIKYRKYTALLFIFGLFIFGFTGFLLYFYSRSVSRKVRILRKMSFDMRNGLLTSLKGIDSQDEFGDISENINVHIGSLAQKNDFIQKTSELNFETEPEIISDSDILGYSLKKMKINLIEKDKKEQINKEEKSVQDRHIEGLAKFGGILRHNTDKPELLAYEIVSNLVKFLKADVCGIYFLSADNELVPMATYAYNERKIYEKVILPGEGLVGTCAVEKTTFYFDNLPDDYIQIISGFGKMKPRSLLITPLVLNNEVFGVLELASLIDFNKADIYFTETLGEDIASTFAFMRVKNMTTLQMKNLSANFLKSSYSKKNSL